LTRLGLAVEDNKRAPDSFEAFAQSKVTQVKRVDNGPG